MLDADGLAALLEAYSLGDGVLSTEPVATGRLGEVWRLDGTDGSWAVKRNRLLTSEHDVAPGAAFQDAAVAAGVPAPRIRRTRDGRVLADIGGTQLRVLEWVDLDEPDPGLDPVAVGQLLARLHLVPAVRDVGALPDVPSWFCAPVGLGAWDRLVDELRARRAPFADDLATHRDELVALEALLEPPRALQWCHRDLFADNVRSTPGQGPGGRLCVFDFDNSGPQDPSYELAFVLVEYATSDAPSDAPWHAAVDESRVRLLRDAYAQAGGPGRVTRPADFSMVIAVLGHIAELAATRWLAATAEPARRDLADWVRELTRRPLTREVVARILDA